MNIHYRNKTCGLMVGLLGLMAIPTAVRAASGESMVLDPRTGNYTITYYSIDPPYHPLEQVLWVPATKIEPRVKTSLTIAARWHVGYRYEVVDGRRSKEKVAMFLINFSRIDPQTERTPPLWNGSCTAAVTHPYYYGGWGYVGPDTLGGIPPGHRLRFGFESLDLPGVFEARLMGGRPQQGFPDEGPSLDSPVGQQFNVLHDHDYVVRYAAVPWIPVPTPFTVAPVLMALQHHVDDGLVRMKLIDPVLVTQIDPLFQEAIAASQGGNTTALRRTLQALRRILAASRGPKDRGAPGAADTVEDRGVPVALSPDHPIAPIARRVLDFDLRYLERRVPAGD